jgi:AcrR family transcriptional regulator
VPRLVKTVVTRAGLPESAFYEVFGSADECYRAAFEEGVARLSRSVLAAAHGQERWLERIRLGLVALLAFLDDEPRWARLLIVEAQTAGVAVAIRQRVFAALAECVNEGREETSDGATDPGERGLTDELVLGGLLSVLHARVVDPSRGPLVELAPALLSFVVTSYLGRAAAGKALTRRAPSGDEARLGTGQRPIRATARTMMVLGAITQVPLSSNREIAEAAGLADEGQASKLLGRLEERGLIENLGLGQVRGEPNAWLLTSYGRRVAALSSYRVAADPRVSAEAASAAGRRRGDR